VGEAGSPIGVDSSGKVVVLRDTPPALRYHAILPGATVSLCGIFPYDLPAAWATAPDDADVTWETCLKKIRAVMPPADSRPALRIKPAFRKPKPVEPKEPTGRSSRRTGLRTTSGRVTNWSTHPGMSFSRRGSPIRRRNFLNVFDIQLNRVSQAWFLTGDPGIVDNRFATR
jgi:hypothetical protein